MDSIIEEKDTEMADFEQGTSGDGNRQRNTLPPIVPKRGSGTSNEHTSARSHHRNKTTENFEKELDDDDNFDSARERIQIKITEKG